MTINVRKALRKPTAANTIYLIKNGADIKHISLTEDETEYVKKEHRAKTNVIEINRYKNRIYLVYNYSMGLKPKRMEDYRQFGNEAQILLNKAKIERVVINANHGPLDETLSFAQGLLLGNYQFLKYKNEKSANSLTEIDIYHDEIKESDLFQLRILVESVYSARDLVNEPVSFLNAERFAEEIKSLAIRSGAKVEVFNKKKIESLKMGGLLAVNKGSIDPPTFTTIEWNPENKINTKPYVFVGKGVVYDTGGLSLKTGNYMDTMKCDMAGGAAVAAAISAIARTKIPVYVIGLIPATDNRPDGNAYVPGDIVTMFDGTTVEVLNTDAEGRMILADALSYAKKFTPELVIDIATLTGSASRAIGSNAMVGMNVKAENEFEQLCRSGEWVHERIVEFPMWDEYKEQLKSEVADLKNIGGSDAGAITAAKFLEHFTNYPFIHLDIAGPAFLEKKNSYRGIGGTGVGVRLFFDFILNKSLG